MDPELPVGAERARAARPAARPADRTPGLPPWVERLLARAPLDFRPRSRQPAWGLLAVASVVALGLSLGADELVVHVTTHLVPATGRFPHFRLSDYGPLTVVGVLVACAGWPVVTRLTSQPRRLFVRAAVALTLVLWLPDAWLFVRGEQTAGVAALMAMHLAIALVTYNTLVRMAPVGPLDAVAAGVAPVVPAVREQTVRRVWNAMAALVGLELVLGVATIVTVPFRRPNALVPSRGAWLYAAHGAVGIALGIGAVGVLALSLLTTRMARIGAVLGGIGVLVGVAGGVLATFQQTRLVGMGVMMVGVVVAGIGYLVPALEAMGKAEAAKAQAAKEAMARANEARAAGAVGTTPQTH